MSQAHPLLYLVAFCVFVATAACGGDDSDPTTDDTGGADAGTDTSGADAATELPETVDDAIALAAASYGDFISSACDCLTDSDFSGDRTACEDAQPATNHYFPNGCAQSAYRGNAGPGLEAAACNAFVVEELAQCFAECPADGGASCIADAESGFEDCDRLVDPTLAPALEECGDGGLLFDTVDEALEHGYDGNDEFVARFCDCFTDVTYDGDREACESAQTSRESLVPPACVVQAFEAHPDESIDYLTCYGDVFYDLAECVTECPESQSDLNDCYSTSQDSFGACRAARDADLSADIATCP